MKNNITIKVITIFAILISIFMPTVNATINPDNYKPGELTSNDYYVPFKFAGTILNAITIVGVVISITMVMVLGMKYMTGSLEERAEYKQTMKPMLIGAILLFCSSTIVSIIYKLVSQVN